jgi:hypothetical protein
MSYRVMEPETGCAILRQNYDAVFATEAEAQALCDLWRIQFPRVPWKVERCGLVYYRAGKYVPYPVNAEWMNGQVRRLDRPTRRPTGGTPQP